MSNIQIQTGSEGPRHDPYGYTETTVTRSGGDVVTLHEGLGEWVEVNGKRFDQSCYEIFEHVAGITPRIAERVYDRRRSTCQNCGSRDLGAKRGYPGETFYICMRCDNIVHVDFDRSAII